MASRAAYDFLPSKAAMKDAQMRPNEVDQVILVGGMTRMPKVRTHTHTRTTHKHTSHNTHTHKHTQTIHPHTHTLAHTA